MISDSASVRLSSVLVVKFGFDGRWSNLGFGIGVGNLSIHYQSTLELCWRLMLATAINFGFGSYYLV